MVYKLATAHFKTAFNNKSIKVTCDCPVPFFLLILTHCRVMGRVMGSGHTNILKFNEMFPISNLF